MDGIYSLNSLDFTIIGVAVIGLSYGLGRGALRMVSSIVSLVAGIYLASIYYPQVQAFALRELTTNQNAAAAIGWVVVFAAVFSGVEAVARTVQRVLSIA